MKNSLSNVFIFAVGAIIGATVTWKLVKTRYEQIAQEEIDSVKETFSRLHDESTDIEEKAKMVKRANDLIKEKKELHEHDMKAYASKIEEAEYVNYSDSNVDKKRKVTNVRKPYVISPDEFEELDYSIISLSYYADGVLADDCDEVIEDVENTVGEDFASHFGEYEDDSVFVRNDELEIDYEILRDTRKYSDIVNNDSHHTEDE